MQRGGGQGRHSLTEGQQAVLGPIGPHSQPGDNPVESEPGRPRSPVWAQQGMKATEGEGRRSGRRAALLAVSRAENETQSHQTSMGENFQRSGWPMCSRLAKGEELHWNGGSWSHVGPLTATM